MNNILFQWDLTNGSNIYNTILDKFHDKNLPEHQKDFIKELMRWKEPEEKDGFTLEIKESDMPYFISLILGAEIKAVPDMNPLKIIPFYWEGDEEAIMIYDKLRNAALTLEGDLGFVARQLLADGSPSIYGYILKMNYFYMEQFIKIVTFAY